MINNLIIFLIIVIPFAISSISQDIKYRRISNITTLSFIYISFLIFCFFWKLYHIIDYFILILCILVSFFLYRKKLWGGADGKITISICMLLIALGNNTIFTSFILNIILFYTLIITLLIIFKTQFKIKLKVLKKIDYGSYLFYLLLIFLFVKRFINYLSSIHTFFTILLTLIIFVILGNWNKYINIFYKKMNDIYKLISLLILAFVLFFFSDMNVIKYFFIVLAFRIFVDFISNMTIFLKDKQGKQYNSPFSVYIFASAIFSFLVGQNIISIILKLLLKS